MLFIFWSGNYIESGFFYSISINNERMPRVWAKAYYFITKCMSNTLDGICMHCESQYTQNVFIRSVFRAFFFYHSFFRFPLFFEFILLLCLLFMNATKLRDSLRFTVNFFRNLLNKWPMNDASIEIEILNIYFYIRKKKKNKLNKPSAV